MHSLLGDRLVENFVSKRIIIFAKQVTLSLKKKYRKLVMLWDED